MTQTAAQKTPWIITFQRKDLLAACWGSKKGADLLYHFLHRASWEKKNKHENETLKDIKFQESTPKALEKSGLSLGSFHTYVKHFVSVGYISTEAYTGEYIIHIDVIEQAFKKAPEKPVSATTKPRQSSSESFKLKDCNFVTLPREEYEKLLELKDECFKLKEMFQSLKLEHAQMQAELKEMFQSLKQNPTIDSAQEAEAGAFSEVQSNDLRIREDDSREREKEDGASAPAHAAESEIPYLPDFMGTQEAEKENESHPASEQSSQEEPPAPEQSPLIERPAVPEMPLPAARWCAETAILVSEALRGKYYTDNQRKNQQSAARRMFQSFKTITRAQFEEIFADWVAWWRDHDKGFFTLADLLARGQNREVRLQTALDRLEARASSNKPAQPTNNQSQQHRASSPSASSASARLPEDLAQRNKDRLKAKYEAIMAAQQAAIV